MWFFNFDLLKLLSKVLSVIWLFLVAFITTEKLDHLCTFFNEVYRTYLL